MSKRTAALVNRGKMDNTPVIIWQHEIAILEEIHGDEHVTEVPVEMIADDDDAVVLKGTMNLINIKGQNVAVDPDDENFIDITSMIRGEPSTVRHEIERIPLKKLISHQLKLGSAFAGDPQEEYNRLQALYGLHPNEPKTVVEVVYGRFQEGRFEKACGTAKRRRQAVAA